MRRTSNRLRLCLELVRDRIASDRGSVYLEYALVGTLVFVGAISAFAPGSIINEALGSDWAFREILIKLPIF